MEEVRYHFMRPAQVLLRRNNCPIAFVPIGALEWHGPQNPLGADAFQAEALAVMAAEKSGGIAFPPLYYGENRLQLLQEAKPQTREEIAVEMQLPWENFMPEFYPFTASEQARHYQTLLIHILAQVESLGFKLCVFVAGHYPLIDCARAATLEYNLRVRHHRAESGMLAWAALDALLCEDRYENAGDHGCGWETSHLLYSHPECVDMSALPPRGEYIPGLSGTMPAQDATLELGRETFEYAANKLVKEAMHRLEHPELYKRCGHWLDEGLWRK